MRDLHSELSLGDLCKTIPDKSSVVEIGCFAGEGTVVLSKYFDIVHAVDPWEFEDMLDLSLGMTCNRNSFPLDSSLVELAFDEKVNGIPNIIKHKMKGDNFVKEVPDESLGLVYIDDIHLFKRVIRNIALWSPKLSPEGVMSGHDYIHHFPEVVEAVDYAKMISGKSIRVYPDFSWVLF